MADLKFSQPARSNFFKPIALAVLVLAVVVFLVIRFTPHTTADLTVQHIDTWQAHTVYKNDTILVGQDKVEDEVYVLVTVRMEDRLRLPLFLKDFNATVTTDSGDTLATSGVEKADLDSLYVTFPEVKKLATTPLLRETEIDPGHAAEGMVMLHFPMTQDAWNKRKSAELTVDLYHQASQTVALSPESVKGR